MVFPVALVFMPMTEEPMLERRGFGNGLQGLLCCLEFVWDFARIDVEHRADELVGASMGEDVVDGMVAGGKIYIRGVVVATFFASQ